MSNQPARQLYNLRYPDGVTLMSEGRNGFVNTRGIEFEVTDRHVELAPITSKGFAARSCMMRLPRDPAVLIEMAAKLKDIASTL